MGLGALNFSAGIILLVLLIWTAIRGLNGGPGDVFTGLAGAILLLAAFLYFIFRRFGIFSISKGLLADLHILLGSAGVGLIVVHSGGVFLSFPGLLTIALTLLFLLGLNLRFFSSRQIHRNFASRPHLFFQSPPTTIKLESILEAKKALLKKINSQAYEGTFRLGFKDWVSSPGKAGRYWRLNREEKKGVREACGNSPGYLGFSLGWGRYLHILLGIGAVIGFLFHLIQSCPFLVF
ncbi:MAG: hypothetical protein KKH04_06340 [Proteobacteria bacterium]|nr:hypothetical protein [Pseudomonadota bacterium]